MDTVKINSLNTKMIAHRGCSGLEKENTNPAFVAACNRSYFGVETDVHVTTDGKFVIFHDDNTKRVTDGKFDITIEENDYAAIKDIVLPDVDGSTVRGDIRIPLLSEYINICKKYNKICVLEVKNHFTEKDLERLIEEIRADGYLENVIFISFDLENCINLRKLLHDNDVQYLYADKVTDELINTLLENKLNLDIYDACLTEENIKLLHDKGIKVNCWTVNDKTDGERLAAWGVDFITSNILE